VIASQTRKGKQTSFFAILTFALLLSTVNANATPWLDIVKELVSSANIGKTPKTNARPSQEEILNALSRLKNVCAQKLDKQIPCAIGEAKNFSIGDAREEAVDDAIARLAKSMETFIDKSKNKDTDGVIKTVSSYIQEKKLTINQLVSGAQQYLSYTYIDEHLSNENNRNVYVTTVVMVMDSKLFSKALENEDKGKPLSEEIINESRKGLISVFRNFIKKI